MKRKILLASSAGILVFVFFLWIFDISRKQTPPIESHERPATYFETWSVAEFSSGNIPRLKVVINDKELLLSFDLGFTGHVTLIDEQLNTLSERTSLGKKNTQGIQGKRYRRNFYKIPKIKIGNLVLSNITLEEENEESLQESVIVNVKDDTSSPSQGKLGWKLFKTSVVYLDLKRSAITISDSTKTLEEHGDPLKSFVKTALLLDRDLVEFIAITSNGPLRCALDTGSSFNFINRENQDNVSLEKMVFDKQKMVTFSKFEIEGIDFGQTTFHALPLKLPFHVEAMLGMDFFLQHRVAIDFKNQVVYFAADQE